MKTIVMNYLAGILLLGCIYSKAQTKTDQERMAVDVEIAANVLKTLIKQDIGVENFFYSDVKGFYTPGHGVTLSIPIEDDFLIKVCAPFSNRVLIRTKPRQIKVLGKKIYIPDFEYHRRNNDDIIEYDNHNDEDSSVDRKDETSKESRKKKRRQKDEENSESDSSQQEETDIIIKSRIHAHKYIKKNKEQLINNFFTEKETDNKDFEYDKELLDISKKFMADYGDIISQLAPDEKIVITNQPSHNQKFRWQDDNRDRIILSVEALGEDLIKLRLGKITREQFIDGLKIVNTIASRDEDKDLEIIASLFEKLYDQDLSKTYFVSDKIVYGRLVDLGVHFDMSVYSSTKTTGGRFYIPTQQMGKLTQEQRDSKVKELYPQFEKDLKEKILDYGRVIKGMKDHEQLFFNVELTECASCGIPDSIEVSIKFLVLKDYNAGKIKKEVALSKIKVNKIGVQ